MPGAGSLLTASEGACGALQLGTRRHQSDSNRHAADWEPSGAYPDTCFKRRAAAWISESGPRNARDLNSCFGQRTLCLAPLHRVTIEVVKGLCKTLGFR